MNFAEPVRIRCFYFFRLLPWSGGRTLERLVWRPKSRRMCLCWSVRSGPLQNVLQPCRCEASAANMACFVSLVSEALLGLDEAMTERFATAMRQTGHEACIGAMRYDNEHVVCRVRTERHAEPIALKELHHGTQICLLTSKFFTSLQQPCALRSQPPM